MTETYFLKKEYNAKNKDKECCVKIHGYDNNALSKPLNLEMKRGKEIALVGANGIGIGNTSLLKSLMGLLSPVSDEVEQAKVRLCKLINKENNILILDEPTNHLDVDAKEELKRVLQNYSGSILLVCHESEFYKDVVTDVWNCEDWTLKLA